MERTHANARQANGRADFLEAILGETDELDWIPLAHAFDLVVGGGSNASVITEWVRASQVEVRAAWVKVPVVATLGSNNLSAVARVSREHRPNLDIIICADDDPELLDNPNIRQNLGLEAAKAAALEVNARLALPPREAPHGT